MSLRTLDEIVAAMKRLDHSGDLETAHCTADDLLIEALRRACKPEDQMTCEAIITAFEKLDKWYA